MLKVIKKKKKKRLIVISLYNARALLGLKARGKVYKKKAGWLRGLRALGDGFRFG